jgi:hypothetical protein
VEAEIAQLALLNIASIDTQQQQQPYIQPTNYFQVEEKSCVDVGAPF